MIRTAAICCLLFLIWAFARPLPLPLDGESADALPLRSMELIERIVPPNTLPRVDLRSAPAKRRIRFDAPVATWRTAKCRSAGIGHWQIADDAVQLLRNGALAEHWIAAARAGGCVEEGR